MARKYQIKSYDSRKNKRGNVKGWQVGTMEEMSGNWSADGIVAMKPARRDWWWGGVKGRGGAFVGEWLNRVRSRNMWCEDFMFDVSFFIFQIELTSKESYK